MCGIAGRLVGDAVRMRLSSDVPLGVFLSGGVDSSVVAYEAAQALGPGLQTFTVSTVGDLDESHIAQSTARTLGIKNSVLPLTLDPTSGVQSVVEHYDQPYADSSAIPSLQIATLAAEHVSVVLNGDGGDEIFGGYNRHVAARRVGHVRSIPRSVSNALARSLTPLSHGRRSPIGMTTRFFRGAGLGPQERYLVFTNDMLRECDKRAHWRGGNVLASERLIRAHESQQLSSLDQQMANDLGLNLLSDLLVKMDIACMAASLEGRSPFMDHLLADFALHLPDHLKIGPRARTKHVLKEAYRGRIPDEVLAAPKRGFEIPLQQWLDTDLKPLLNDTLGGPDSRVSAFLDDDVRLGLVHRYALTDHNTAYLSYALLVLELWLRRQEEIS